MTNIIFSRTNFFPNRLKQINEKSPYTRLGTNAEEGYLHVTRGTRALRLILMTHFLDISNYTTSYKEADVLTILDGECVCIDWSCGFDIN